MNTDNGDEVNGRTFGGYYVPVEYMIRLRRSALEAMLLCFGIGALMGGLLPSAWWVIAGITAAWLLGLWAWGWWKGRRESNSFGDQP